MEDRRQPPGNYPRASHHNPDVHTTTSPSQDQPVHSTRGLTLPLLDAQQAANARNASSNWASTVQPQPNQGHGHVTGFIADPEAGTIAMMAPYNPHDAQHSSGAWPPQLPGTTRPSYDSPGISNHNPGPYYRQQAISIPQTHGVHSSQHIQPDQQFATVDGQSTLFGAGKDDGFNDQYGEKRICASAGCEKPLAKKSSGTLCNRCEQKHRKNNAETPSIQYMPMGMDKAREILRPPQPPLHRRGSMRIDGNNSDYDTRQQIAQEGWWHKEMIKSMNKAYDVTEQEARMLHRSPDHHHALLKTQMDFNKKFHDQPKQYNDAKINARVRWLWDTVVVLYQGGELPYDDGGDNAGYNIDAELLMSLRLRRICNMLELDKRICIDVIEGRGVNAFARDPHAYEKRKQDNITSNNKKSKAAKAKKQGLDLDAEFKTESDSDQAVAVPPPHSMPEVVQIGNKTLITDPPRPGKAAGAKRKGTFGGDEQRAIKRQATEEPSHIRTPVLPIHFQREDISGTGSGFNFGMPSSHQPGNIFQTGSSAILYGQQAGEISGTIPPRHATSLQDQFFDHNQLAQLQIARNLPAVPGMSMSATTDPMTFTEQAPQAPTMDHSKPPLTAEQYADLLRAITGQFA